MPDLLVDALKKHRRWTALRGELVFSDTDGGLLARDNSKHALKRACRRATLREITHHAMRHTYASHLAMLGVPLKVIQELLGHATMEMTMRYAHLAPDVHADAVQVLDSRDVFSLQRTSVRAKVESIEEAEK